MKAVPLGNEDGHVRFGQRQLGVCVDFLEFQNVANSLLLFGDDRMSNKARGVFVVYSFIVLIGYTQPCGGVQN